jgi:ankyrin repeat protein
VLHLLLDRGADPKVVSRDGRSGAWAAVATNRWDAALLLVERGASVDGTSPMGLSLLDTLEQHVRLHGDGGGVAALLAAVRTRTKGK